MIAAACLASHLPPESFGVPASPELGAVMLTLMAEQAKEQERQERLAKMRKP
jgi:hypothetical protein